MNARSYLMALVLLAIVPSVGASQDWQDFADHQYGFAMNLPSDWTVTLESTDVISVYGLPILKFYEMIDSGG